LINEAWIWSLVNLVLNLLDGEAVPPLIAEIKEVVENLAPAQPECVDPG
jgi:hypothetical protein